MTYTNLKQFSHRPLGFVSALLLAFLWVSNPVVTSSTAHAQESEAVASVASININTASAEVLASRLTGVGISRAQEIVRYRETYGPFASIEELGEVKGIGSSTINKNRALITLE